MTPAERLHGLIAATFTPFTADGALDLPAVERQAAHLVASGVHHAFIGGTTGECHSLSLVERQALARRWIDVARGTPLRVVCHVGSNCLADARVLAAQAQELGCTAISAFSPSYFKPRSLDALVDCCARIAGAAPATPFYFYDIPVFTGVTFPMPAFLERAADRVPTLAGLKFSNPDLAVLLQCLEAGGGRWDVTWGIDEALLGALAMGVRGAVGSSYNFAAPLYHRLLAAFARGDLPAARAAQHQSARLIGTLARHGYLAAAKATMSMLGVELGPVRLPLTPLRPEEISELRRGLEELGFFEWAR